MMELSRYQANLSSRFREVPCAVSPSPLFISDLGLDNKTATAQKRWSEDSLMINFDATAKREDPTNSLNH
ncbi:MAG: hypothetical protein RBR25_09980 [Trichloromonas sp.]|nr:hypothetical protein [Trichloromonas sp.]